eukprot:12122815-Heterocapsa_arctica.AAC.1
MCIRDSCLRGQTSAASEGLLANGSQSRVRKRSVSEVPTRKSSFGHPYRARQRLLSTARFT